MAAVALLSDRFKDHFRQLVLLCWILPEYIITRTVGIVARNAARCEKGFPEERSGKFT